MTRPVGIGALLLLVAATAPAQSLFELPSGVETRWYSFENPLGRSRRLASAFSTPTTPPRA